LPHTLNGKVDRKALRALDWLRAEPGVEGGTLTPIEEIIAGIWCEVLGQPSIARNGNFFNLGGHSLLGTQGLAPVRECLGVELAIRSLVESPTLAEFSQLVEEHVNQGQQSQQTAITRVSRDGELPLSFAQQRMWFFEELSNGASAFNIALGVRLKGSLNV